MRDTRIPPGSLVMVELDNTLYNIQARQEIAAYIRDVLLSQPFVVGAYDHPTVINVLAPAVKE